MVYRISETCINCGSCITECPQDAIIDSENNRRKITPEKCNDCGYCVDTFSAPRMHWKE